MANYFFFFAISVVGLFLDVMHKILSLYSALSNKVYFTFFFFYIRRLIHSTALALTLDSGCNPAVFCAATTAAFLSSPLLKVSTQMEKWQALRRQQPCRSPAFVFSLPVIIFSFV